MGAPAYEEQFGPIEKRFRRVIRALRWTLKGWIGAHRELLLEIRWRLGDEIIAQPLYAGIKSAFPGTKLSVLCTYPDLLAHDSAVDSCNPDGLDPDRYIYIRDAAREVNRLEHYARLAGIDPPSERPRVTPPEPLSSDWNLPRERRVVVAPGASWHTKRWSADNWRAVVRRLETDGFEVVVLGNAGEGVDAGRDLTGRTSVLDCARFLAGASVCISSDSGLMHLALAVGTRTVALFGPTNPVILVRDQPDLHVITNERDCRFCWNDSQAMQEPGVCPRAIPDCLGTIEVDKVVDAVRTVLGPTQ